MHEELDIVQQIGQEMGPAFQEHYKDFCDRHRIDIEELNREKKLHRDKAFAEHDSHLDKTNERKTSDYSGAAEMILYEGDPGTGRPESKIIDSPTTSTDEKEMHEAFAKLFKKLALKLHPDKIATADLTDEEKKEYEAMFTKAKAAIEEAHYFLLIDYAEKLKIPLPKNYGQQVKWMKREIGVVQNLITTQMQSYNYMFAEREDIVDKDNLIKQFIFQLFGERIL